MASPDEPEPEKAAAAAECQRVSPTPFLTKTYQMVEDPAVDDLISWNEEGSAFVVWRPAEFARDLLPRYFKHDNFSSFVRQLNTYGFRKVVPDRWEFANDCFRRGERRFLRYIHRRKLVPATAQPAAATHVPEVSRTESEDLSSSSQPNTVACSGGSGTDLSEENARLRQENARLSHELAQMRGLCDKIFALVSKYSSGQQRGEGEMAAAAAPAAAQLELMPVGPAAEEEAEAEAAQSPRLFGVSIRVKRARAEEGGATNQRPRNGRDHVT